MWWYNNKFDSMKSLGTCYWCVKIPHCGYMEHGLKHYVYVQKHKAAFAMCYNQGLVCDKPLGAPISVKLVYCRLPIWRPFCSGGEELNKELTMWLGVVSDSRNGNYNEQARIESVLKMIFIFHYNYFVCISMERRGSVHLSWKIAIISPMPHTNSTITTIFFVQPGPVVIEVEQF